MLRAFLQFCFVLGLQGAVDPDLGSPAPVIRAAYPPGAQRGTTVKVELSGANLYDAQSIEFAGRGIQARIVDRMGSKLALEVRVERDAEVGHRDFRLTTKRGVAIGSFEIGTLPEIVEKEKNDDWRDPQPISLPVLVNGNIGNEDWDHFRIHAEAGQKLIFDVGATRYGSRLDADVAILDTRGREMAWVDDTTIFGDPHLEYTFENAGEYIIRVGSLNGGGNYRLAAGALPYVRRAFPAGLQAGKQTRIALTGSLLDRIDEVWVGDRLSKGRIVSRSATEIVAQVQVPPGTPEGAYQIHAAGAGLEVAVPTEIRISQLPEVTVTTAPSAMAGALATTVPAVVNGVILEPKQSHYFKFEAAAGERFLFRAESMKLGYHLDPTITILGGDGTKAAYADDPGIDDRSDEFQLDPDLSFRCEKAGTYYVAIRDGMYRGGEQLVYRLTMLRQAPDFVLELREPLKALYVGQEDTVQVRVRRRTGWDAPVEVWAEGLPAGIASERVVVEPKDSVVKDTCGVSRDVDGTIVQLPIRATAAAGPADFRIVARGVMDGRTVEHTATVRYSHNSVGYLFGPMQVERAQLTVAEPPLVQVTSPDSVTLKGDTIKLKLGVRRFGAAKQTAVVVRPQSLPNGLSVEPATVAAGVNEVTLSLRGSGAGARIQFDIVSEKDGKVLAQSLPIRLEAGR